MFTYIYIYNIYFQYTKNTYGCFQKMDGVYIMEKPYENGWFWGYIPLFFGTPCDSFFSDSLSPPQKAVSQSQTHVLKEQWPQVFFSQDGIQRNQQIYPIGSMFFEYLPAWTVKKWPHEHRGNVGIYEIYHTWILWVWYTYIYIYMNVYTNFWGRKPKSVSFVGPLILKTHPIAYNMKRKESEKMLFSCNVASFALVTTIFHHVLLQWHGEFMA